MKISNPTQVTITALNAGIDADLNLGIHKIATAEVSTGLVKTDHIAEKTAAHGIVHDNNVKVDHIAETTGAHGVSIDSPVMLDHIAEKTAAHGIVLDNTVKVDHIAERTGAHGIVHDNPITTDHIAETTAAHGIEFDDMPINVIRTTVASDNLKASNDATVTAATSQYSAMKVLQIPTKHAGGGTVRIKMDMWNSAGNGNVQISFTPFGISYRTEPDSSDVAPVIAANDSRAITTVQATYSFDITVPDGVSIIGVQVRGGTVGSTTSISNVRLYYDVV